MANINRRSADLSEGAKPSLTEGLDVISRLTEGGRFLAARRRAVILAKSHCENVRARLAAAYACDRCGADEEALVHYEAAHKLGVPKKERFAFLTSFGSTLGNAGRIDEAVQRLQQAVDEYPSEPAARAFLALALHRAGRSTESTAQLLRAALAAAKPSGFGRYTRALSEYQRLLEAEMPVRDPHFGKSSHVRRKKRRGPKRSNI